MTIKTKPGCRRVMNATVRATDYVCIIIDGRTFGWVTPAMSVGCKVRDGKVIRKYEKLVTKITCCRPVKTKSKK